MASKVHTRESSVVTGSHRCGIQSIVAFLWQIYALLNGDARIDARIADDAIVFGVARRHHGGIMQ
jgi:hypothetical protein